MKDVPLYLGIDFGTTNSSIAYVYGDPRHRNAQSVPVEPVRITMDEENNLHAERMPTLLSTRFDDRRAKGLARGWEFFNIFGRKKKSPLLRRGRDLFDSVKSDLGSHRVYAIAASPECNTPKKVATCVLQALLEQASKKLPLFKPGGVRAVITVPASLNAEARRETREAAIAAGLNGDLIELIDEPIAALLHLLNDQTASAILSMEEPRNILVFDYGGGTLDLCLVKCSFNLDSPNGLVAENLAISQYRRNGGNDVDGAIMEEVIWPQVEEQLALEREDLPADLRKAVEDTLTSTLARKLKEKLCLKIQKQMNDGCDYARVRADLSETVVTDGTFFDERLGAPIQARFKMTKAQFDDVMAPFLLVPSEASDLGAERFSHSLIAPIWDCIAKAGLDPVDLDVLVLHGGSCRNPCVAGRLRELLAADDSPFSRGCIVQTPDLDTSVACGAALACYWRHERGVELIKPVTAEDIGIITLGGSPVCLIASGTPLPFPAEGIHEHPTDFYVAQNGQKELIIPFYAGRTEGTPRLSGIVKVPLAEGARKGDTIKLKLTVDKDKIMHWWYRVAGGEFMPATPFDDPWSPHELEPPDRRLLAFRRRMEEELLARQALPEWMLREEASLAHAAGRLGEAELLLLDLISLHPPSGHAVNLLSLVYGALGRNEEELRYSKEAAALEPGNPILVGNHGCTLSKAGRTDEAIAWIRRALGMSPELDYLYEWLGDIYRQRGQEETALREYHQGIRMLQRRCAGDQSSIRAWRDLARLHRKIGDYDQAGIAEARLADAKLNDLYDGDHRQRIAGPDSGFLSSP